MSNATEGMEEGSLNKVAAYAPRSDATMRFSTVISAERLGGSPLSIVCAPSGVVWVMLSSHQLVSINQQNQIGFTAGRQREAGYVDGQAGLAKFNFASLSGCCLYASGSICAADTGNHVLRLVDPPAHEVKTLAGSQAGCVDGEALLARFSFPTSVVATSLGYLMVCDSGNNRIRLIAEGMVYTVAGCGTGGHLDGPALDSMFNWPSGIQVTADGEILVADTYNHTIRYISEEIVSTVSGTPGVIGFKDGPLSEATFSYPARLSWTQSGELLIVDMGSDSLRVMNTDSTVSTLIGLGKPSLGSPSLLSAPVGVDSADDGRVFIADKEGVHVAAWKSQKQLDEEQIVSVTQTPSPNPRSSTILAPSHLLSSKKRTPSGSKPASPFSTSLSDIPSNSLTESQSIPPPPDSPPGSEKLEPGSLVVKTTEPLAPGALSIPVMTQISDPVEADSHFIKMDDLDGFDPSSVVQTEKPAETRISLVASPPTSPRTPRAEVPLSTPLATPSKSQSHQLARVVPNVDGNFLSQGVVSPEAAEIFDCVDAIHVIYNGDAAIDRELVSKLKILSRQMVRSFATILKRYQECVQSSPTESYLNTLIAAIEPLCKHFMAIGSTMIALEATANGGPVAASLEPLAVLVSSIKDGLSLLELTMSSLPEGSDAILTLPIPNTEAFPSIARPGSGMLQLPGSFVSDASISMQELEASGKVTRWAPIRRSCGLFVNRHGDVFATTTDHLVVKFEASGSMTVLAGLSGKGGYVNGPAVTAQFRFLRLCGLVQEERSNGLVIVDSGNHCLRYISSDYQNVTTHVGDAKRPGFKDGPVDLARFNTPSSVVQSLHGELFVADTGNNRIRLIANGIVSTIGGSGQRGSNDGSFLEASFRSPSGLCLSPDGDLYVADYHNHLIRKLSGGFVTTIAGDGTEGYVDGEARSARFANPISITMTPTGDLIVSDYYNHCLRCISNEKVTTFVGVPKLQGNKNGFGLEASFAFPTELALLPSVRVPVPRSQTSATTLEPSNPSLTSTTFASPPTSPRNEPSFSSARFIPPLQLGHVAPSNNSAPPSALPSATSKPLLNSETRALNSAKRVTVTTNNSQIPVLPISPSQPSLAPGATPLVPHEPTKEENRLLIADSTSIRILHDFSLPVHVFKGDIGLSLVQMSWEGGHRYQPQSWIVDALIALKSTGIVIRDLWTLSSELSHVRPVIERILSGASVDWYMIPPRVVATVLKSFFQKLPAPLLTMELQDIFITAAQPIYEAPSKRLSLLQAAVKAMPVANRILLKHLVSLFVAFEDTLHIPPVWGPILLLRRSLGSFRDSMRASARVVAALIQHHEALFSGLELPTHPPPFWLCRINHADQVQESLGPFIRSLLMTRDRLARVTTAHVDIRDIFENVELMRELLFALQEQFLNTPVLHVIERYHLLRFHSYLTSFQDAWVKLDDPQSYAPTAANSTPATLAPSSSANNVQSTNFHRPQHQVLATGTDSASDSSAGKSGSQKVAALVSLFSSPSAGAIPSAKSSTTALGSQGSPKKSAPSSPASSGKLARQVGTASSGSSVAPLSDAKTPEHTSPLANLQFAENTLSISNSDSENDFDVVAPLKSDYERWRLESGKEAPRKIVKKSTAPVSSAPASLSPLQARLNEETDSNHSGSTRSGSRPSEGLEFGTPTKIPRTPIIPQEVANVFGSSEDGNQGNADGVSDGNSAVSPILVAPQVAGVSPSLVVPMATGVPHPSESSENQVHLQNSGRPPLSHADREAREEDHLLMGLLRTTKIRNQLDRLVLSALYELLLFSFSVDLAYRGALFANPQVMAILDIARGQLDQFPGARLFWKKLSDSPVVSWRTFKAEFARTYPNTTAEEFVMLRKVLDNHAAGLISASHFAQFLKAFGPMDHCIERLAAVYHAPWFKSYMTAAEAEHLLCGAPKNSFVLRFSSTHPGSFAVSSSHSEDPNDPMSDFEISHRRIELITREDSSIGFRLASHLGLKLTPHQHSLYVKNQSRRKSQDDDRSPQEVFSSLADLAQHLIQARSMSAKHPDNIFLEPYCFGEISEAEANSTLEMEALGTYLLRLEPRFRLKYRTIHGIESAAAVSGQSNTPYHQMDLISGVASSSNPSLELPSAPNSSRSESDSIEKSSGSSSNTSGGAPKSVCAPGRFWLSYIKNAVYAPSAESSTLGTSYLDQVDHIELKRDVNGNWSMKSEPKTGGSNLTGSSQSSQTTSESNNSSKFYPTLKELIDDHKQLFVAPYTHLPSISPIMQDDQDDKSLVLSTILQDEEGEDGYAVDIRSAMVRPFPKTEEPLAAIAQKIHTNREAPDDSDVSLLTDYLAAVPEAAERLLRPKLRRGTTLFGSIRKDFLRTDVVRLEATNLPLFKLTTFNFNVTAGDKPIRWSIADPSHITDYCFFACSPTEGALSKNESVSVRVSVVLYKAVAVQRLLRVLTFSSDAQFVSCLPVFVRTTADVALCVLREPGTPSTPTNRRLDGFATISERSASNLGLGHGGSNNSFSNSDEYWKIPPNSLTDTTVIESGVSATVFRANLHGAFVVQKRFILRTKANDPYTVDLKSFETELQVLRTVRHDNVASFVGAWCDVELNSVYIVLKYAEYGSIAHYLNVDASVEDVKGRPLSVHELMLFEATSAPSTSSSTLFKPQMMRRSPSGSGSSSSLSNGSKSKRKSLGLDKLEHPPETRTFAFKLSMALDAARAIHYLHRHNILHRDIKTQNMLVDTHYRVQLADFGESRETATSMMTLGRGTPKYRAPELYTRVYNNKVDIFSLGLVMAELFGAKLSLIPGFVEQDKPLLPPMPLGLPTAFLSLLKACCLRNPSKRPTAKQVVQILNLIRRDVLDQEGRSRLSPRSRYAPK